MRYFVRWSLKFRTADEVFDNSEGLKDQALLHRPMMPALEKLKQNREFQIGKHSLTKDSTLTQKIQKATMKWSAT